MKRLFSITVVFAAAMLSLVFTFVPHHHHSDRIFCLQTDCCEEEEEDTHSHSCDDAPACIVEMQYILSTENGEQKIKTVSSTRNHPFSYTASFFLAVRMHTGILQPPSLCDKACREPLLLYQSACAGLSHGLRAPPASC
ncbi:MAG: hypothetical protein LBD27_01850 [Tannerella sp.]|nr:hypothetical protein [Tannerella sp.]